MLATTYRLPMRPSRRIATAIARAFSSSWSRPKSPIITMSSCEPTSAVSEPTARRASSHSEPKVSPACSSVYEASCDSLRALVAVGLRLALGSGFGSGFGFEFGFGCGCGFERGFGCGLGCGFGVEVG